MKTNPPRRSHHRAASEKQFPARTACAARLRWLLLLLLLTLPAVVQAQFTYTLEFNDTITITGYTGPGGAVVIPEYIDEFWVARIGDSAFSYCTSLTSVTIPNSVTSIGKYAFASCTRLTNVTIPNSVTSIGNRVFSGCTSLTSVTIPNSVTTIGYGAFDYCISLSAITVEALNSVYSSVDGVLFNKNQTLLMRCPEGKAGSYAIPNSVTSIGNGSVSIPSIGSAAFSSCTSLTDVTIGNSVTNIGDAAFSSCTSLTSVTIPDGVVSIGFAAFYSCTSLTNVTIPSTVTIIGYDASAFARCSSLVAISVDAANPFFSSLDGVLFNKEQTTLIEYPGGKSGSYAIPGSVTNIGVQAFQYCTNLTSISIPVTVISFGQNAFLASGLTSVTIPGSVTSFGSGAFWNCTSLTSVTILNGVTSIGEGAFADCAGLPGVTIPNSVTNIGFAAFYYCTSLTSVTIGNSVTSIGQSAFGGCTSLTSVTIPDSITNIEGSAFEGCTSLTSVTIPNSVTSIGSGAFYSCTNLTGVYFQGNAPSVGGNVFGGATNVTVYYLPGTTGWGTTFAGRPTVLWNPLVQTGDASFGVRTNRFGFTITGASNLVIVVEASTSLVNSLWTPMGTNTLIGGSSYFSDPEWTNHPARFYRLRSP